MSPEKRSYLFCGTLIDGSGGPARERVLISLEDGLITDIEDVRDKRGLPLDTEDLSDYTILPGLVDCHVHLFMSGSTDLALREKQLCFSYEEASRTISHHIAEQLRYGIIAVRDGGDYGSYVLRYKSEELHGLHPILLRSAGRAWRAAGRYGRLVGRPPGKGMTLAQSIALDHEQPDHIKIVNSGINSLTDFGKETAPQFSLEELTDAVKAARARGLTVMVHANGRLPVSIAAQAGCRSIEHGYFMGEENLRLLADKQIYWIPTAYPMKAYALHAEKGSREYDISMRNLDHQLGQIRRAGEMGVPIAIGTDAGSLGVNHGAAFAEEMRLLMQAGYTLPEVIRCATQNGAELLGIQSQAGLLKSGAQAKLIAVKGGPSQVIDSLGSPANVLLLG